MTELSQLAVKYGTDKWNHHWYTDHYHKVLRQLKNQPIKLLEIGVGGYKTSYGGESLRMWEAYFPLGSIHGIDIEDKTMYETDRIKIHTGSQTDTAFLLNVYRSMGNSMDVIIDDGSHVPKDIIHTFEVLFTLLNPNGIYIIEDTDTSYWEKYHDRLGPNTVEYFHSLSHSLSKHSGVKSIFSDIVESITFYNNLIIIQKGKNR